jgi:hypothetical protein
MQNHQGSKKHTMGSQCRREHIPRGLNAKAMTNGNFRSARGHQNERSRVSFV